MILLCSTRLIHVSAGSNGLIHNKSIRSVIVILIVNTVLSKKLKGLRFCVISAIRPD